LGQFRPAAAILWKTTKRGKPTVFKKSGVIGVVVALLMTMTAAHAQAFTPRPGPMFNNPWGAMSAKEKQLVKIRNTIRATPKGSTIRIAAYSNDRKDVTDALIAAHKRGVRVQVLLNGNWTSDQTRRLQKRLGGNVSKNSFLRICKYSCRGKAGNLHTKVYLFNRAGKAKNVVMFGSLNLTGYGAKTQWNDLHTETNRKALHGFFVSIFNQMKRDRPVRKPFVRKSIGDFDINVYPRYDKRAKGDPMLANLKRIRCGGAKGATGIGNRTLILINMYGWNGNRGVYLAKKVADLSRKGCVVRVLQSSAGGKVVQILRANGVSVKTPDYDRNANGKRDVFTHAKYMAVSGNYARKPGWHVWTGSQNWSDRSLNGDEVTVHIPRRGVFASYRKNFTKIFDRYARFTG
jgi:hypothetical protein